MDDNYRSFNEWTKNTLGKDYIRSQEVNELNTQQSVNSKIFI
jgi:hypothetical protein